MQVWLLNLPRDSNRFLYWRIHMNARKHILAATLIMALVSLSCGINLPVTRIKTGPTQKVDLLVPMPEGSSTPVELNLEFVAGELKLAPGASDSLASGTATFNVAELVPA